MVYIGASEKSVTLCGETRGGVETYRCCWCCCSCSSSDSSALPSRPVRNWAIFGRGSADISPCHIAPGR